MSQRFPYRRLRSVVRADTLWLLPLLLCASAGAVYAQAPKSEPPPSASAGPAPLPPPAADAFAPPPAPPPPPPPPLQAAPAAEPPSAAVEPMPVPAPNGTLLPPPVAPPIEQAPYVSAPAPPVQPEPDGLAAIESDGEVREPAQKGGRCLLGGLCFGPVLTLGILDVFGIGAQARTDHWGIGFDYQFLKFTTQEIPVSLSLLTVEGRLYPFAGSFFLAGGLAWQHASLSRHVSFAGGGGVPGFDGDVAGKVNIPVLKLGIGLLGRSGFVLGIDLAFGIQLGSNSVAFSSTLPRVDEVVAAEKKVRDRADKFVRAIPFLLQLNLVRIGFLF